MSYYIPDVKTKNTLQNRFFMMRKRADGKQAWPNFRSWMTDFLQIAPPDFNIRTHHVSYDPDLGYTKEGMRIQRISKRTLIDQDERILLAAELTTLLLDPTIDLSLEELVERAKINTEKRA